MGCCCVISLSDGENVVEPMDWLQCDCPVFNVIPQQTYGTTAVSWLHHDVDRVGLNVNLKSKNVKLGAIRVSYDGAFKVGNVDVT